MMPKSAKAKADIKIRLTEKLRSKIEQSARVRGVSMNAEMISRMEESFAHDNAFGGVQGRLTASLMASAFLIAGSRAAGPGAKVSHWINDARIYETATLNVIDVLMVHQPGTTLENIAQRLDSLKTGIADRIAKRRGTL